MIKELSENGSARVHSSLCTDSAPAAPKAVFSLSDFKSKKPQTIPNLKPCSALAEFQESSSGQS